MSEPVWSIGLVERRVPEPLVICPCATDKPLRRCRWPECTPPEWRGIDERAR